VSAAVNVQRSAASNNRSWLGRGQVALNQASCVARRGGSGILSRDRAILLVGGGIANLLVVVDAAIGAIVLTLVRHFAAIVTINALWVVGSGMGGRKVCESKTLVAWTRSQFFAQGVVWG